MEDETPGKKALYLNLQNRKAVVWKKVLDTIIEQSFKKCHIIDMVEVEDTDDNKCKSLYILKILVLYYVFLFFLFFSFPNSCY